MKRLTRLAQDAADRIRRDTGAPFTIVLISDGETTFVGAQVPEIETMRQLLKNALESLESGSASISDLRRS